MAVVGILTGDDPENLRRFLTTQSIPYFVGVGNDTTNITGVLNYYHRNSIFNRDRGNSQRPPFLSSNASPYNLELSSDVAGMAGGLNLNTNLLVVSEAETAMRPFPVLLT